MSTRTIKSPDTLSPAALDGIVEAAQEIAKQRREILARMKKALRENNVKEVVRAARELCGEDERKKGNRVN